MKRKISIFTISLIILAISFNSCKKEEGSPSGFNLFTVQDDMDFGEEFSRQIENNPDEYPLVSEVEYPAAYQHIYRIRDSILNTGLVNFDDTFIWQVKIIHDDSTLNAFAVPGGYLYFYTGIIRYLDNEAQFAGVMAHEMAHVSLRHSTNQLTKVYGISLLLSIILGNDPDALAQIAADLAAGLSSLAFSRQHEYEADEWAVRYTYETSYDARGIGAFFEKMEGAPQPPTFLSTHPSPDDRLEKINETWQQLGGKVGNTYEASYLDFISSLP